MKVLCLAAAFCAVFSIYLDYASGHAHQKREASAYADPNAEPEPGIAYHVGKFCNTSMEGAKSHKQFCKVISDKVVEQVNSLCKKSIKLICKFFTGEKKKKCKAWLYEHLCPVVEGATTVGAIDFK